MTSLLSRYRLQLELGLRMAAAALLSFAAAQLLSVVQVYWAVVTAVVVTQTSLGGSLKAVLDRLAGTIGGAFWGVAVTVALPHRGIGMTLLALAVALVPLSLLVAFRPGYRVAPLTAAIVLLGRFGEGGVVTAAFDRVIEIGLGSVVALAVALALPRARAHRLLLAAGRDALRLMAEQAAALLAGIAEPVDSAAMQARGDRIRAAIEKAATSGDEAARERRSYVTGAPDPDPLVRGLRRIGNDLIMLGRSLRQPLPGPIAARLAAPAAALAAALADHLNGLGDALAGAEVPAPEPLDRAFSAGEAAIAGLRRDGLTRSLGEEDVERVFGLAFALELTRRNLAEFAARIAEVRDARASA
jgi:uncharacterized membrane protein YccC